MMNSIIFNENQSVIFSRAWAGRAFDAKLFKFLVALAKFLLILSLIFSVFGLIFTFLDWVNIEPIFLTLGIWTFLLSAVYLIIRWFFEVDYKSPKLFVNFDQNLLKNQEINYADLLSYRAAKSVLRAKAAASGGKLTPKNLLYGVLRDPRVGFMVLRLGLDMKKMVAVISSSSSEELTKTFELALKTALELRHQKIKVTTLFAALTQTFDPFRELLLDLDLREDDITNVVFWENSLEKDQLSRKEFWKPENRIRTSRGIGFDWSAGWTPTLDRFSRDLTDEVVFQPSLDIIGKKSYIDLLQQGLARSLEDNVLLIGEPGIGKKTVVLGLAQKIIHKKSLKVLNDKRVKELNIAALISGATDIHDVEKRLLLVFNEAVAAGNIILYIDNIQDIFRADEKAGTIDASEIIASYLTSSKFQIVGGTTLEGHRSYIFPKKQVSKSFSSINVVEPEKNDLIRIIEETVPLLEYRTNGIITYRAIKEAISLAEKFLPNQAFPEKVINLLDEGLTDAVVNKKQSFLTPEILQELITEKTHIPVSKIAADEKETLLNLENILHKRVVDQNEAIQVVADAMRRARAGLHAGKRPIGSFLFLGPTGVGKTETCKTMAEAYFGSEKSMIRIDMSEYRRIDSIARLIGNPEDPKAGGILTTQVREHPFSLVLLDEIEKAHPDILNLFLQVFEDGRLTDATGRTTDFTNLMIIGTSNAGAELIRKQVQKGEGFENFKKQLLDHLQQQGIFKPEFLNRFDAVVVFKPLSQNDLLKIAELMLKSLEKTLETKRIKLTYSPEVLQKMVELGYNPEYGARPMRRLIQEKVENTIAKALLGGSLKEGSTYTLKPEDIN